MKKKYVLFNFFITFYVIGIFTSLANAKRYMTNKIYKLITIDRTEINKFAQATDRFLKVNAFTSNRI